MSAAVLCGVAAVIREEWEGAPDLPPQDFYLAVADLLDLEGQNGAHEGTVRHAYALAVARAYFGADR